MANYFPTTITISFTGGSDSPQTLKIKSGNDYTAEVRQICIYGGFWYTAANGDPTFVPWSQITSVYAR
jgi:hypothetical protein